MISQIIEQILSTSTEVPPPSPQAADEPKSYMLSLQYRGRETDNLVRKLNKVTAPIRTVLTLRKLKMVLPSLKPPVPKLLRSRVVYSITCPGCQASYVGKTTWHLKTRFAEHKNINKPVGGHFNRCINTKPIILDDIKILCTTTRGDDYLMALKALYISELNTRDEYRGWTLTLRFWILII